MWFLFLHEALLYIFKKQDQQNLESLMFVFWGRFVSCLLDISIPYGLEIIRVCDCRVIFQLFFVFYEISCRERNKLLSKRVNINKHYHTTHQFHNALTNDCYYIRKCVSYITEWNGRALKLLRNFSMFLNFFIN